MKELEEMLIGWKNNFIKFKFDHPEYNDDVYDDVIFKPDFIDRLLEELKYEI